MAESDHIVPTRDIAIAVTVHRIIPEVCDLKLESLVPLNASYRDQNVVLDRMNRLLLRQIATHTREQIAADLEAARRQKDIAFANLADRRLLWQSQLADLRKRLRESEGQYKSIYASWEADWRLRRKEGVFAKDRVPQAKAALDQMTAQQVELENQITAKEAEIETGERAHEQNIPVFNRTIERAEVALADADRRIACEDE